MTRNEVSRLSDAEILIQIARESLVTHGTALPPTVIAPVRVKEHVFSPHWKKEIHTCPKCGHTGPVDPDFGMRVVRGVERKQSWCVNCRATTNYYNRPRKNAISEAAPAPFLERVPRRRLK